VFTANSEGAFGVRLFFREDGTFVSGLVVSPEPDLDAAALDALV
jgi:hypothetical protein